MSECGRVRDLLQRAYGGNAWHGPSLRALLAETPADQAAAHPIPGTRSIWETALHLTAHLDVVQRRMAGEHVEELPRDVAWPRVTDTSKASWQHTLDALEEAHGALYASLERFPVEAMNATVPGRDYPYYLMLYGIVQHDLYHAGQVTVLLQAQGRQPLG